MPVNKEFKSLYLQKDGISINGIAVDANGDEIYTKEVDKNDKKKSFWYKTNDNDKNQVDESEVKDPKNRVKIDNAELQKQLKRYFARELSKLEAEMQLSIDLNILTAANITKIHTAATNNTTGMTFRKPYFMHEIRKSIDKVLESVGLDITQTKEEEDSDI
jgi:hypothetical protein